MADEDDLEVVLHPSTDATVDTPAMDPPPPPVGPALPPPTIGAPAGGPASPPLASAGVGIVALVAGVLVLAGAFLPLYHAFGFEVTWFEGWGRVGAVVAGLGLLVGGATAFRSPVGVGVAAGAGATFVGIFAVPLRTAIDLVGDDVAELTIGLGLVAWGVAAMGSLVIVGVALLSVRGPARAAWPFVVGVAGVGLFWLGLFVGTDLFADDVLSNLALAVLLVGLPLTALVAVAVRTPAGAGLAIGAACPWVASWLVFAVDGRFGGLPVPFPEAPAVAAVAVLAMTCLGGVWWMAPAAGAVAGGSAGAGGVGFAGAQVVSIVLCAATGLAALGGVAAAEGGGQSDPFSVASGSLDGSEDSSDTASSPVDDEEAVDDERVVEDGYDADGDEDSGSSSSSDDGYDVDVEECVDSAVCDLPEDQQDFVLDLMEESGSTGQDYGGEWVAQLQANSVESGHDQTSSSFDALSAEIPDVEVLYSSDYASLAPGYVVFFVSGPFATGEEAVEHCYSLNRGSRDLCFGRYVSDDPADSGAYAYPD